VTESDSATNKKVFSGKKAQRNKKQYTTDVRYVKMKNTNTRSVKRSNTSRQIQRDIKEANLFDELGPQITQTRDELLKMQKLYTLETKYISLANTLGRLPELEYGLNALYELVTRTRCHISRALQLPKYFKLVWIMGFICRNSQGGIAMLDSMENHAALMSDQSGKFNGNFAGGIYPLRAEDKARYLLVKIYVARYLESEKNKTAKWLDACLKAFKEMPGIDPKENPNDWKPVGQSKTKDKVYNEFTKTTLLGDGKKVEFGDWEKDEKPLPKPTGIARGFAGIGGNIHSFVSWAYNRSSSAGTSVIDTCKDTVSRLVTYVRSAVSKYFADLGLEIVALIVVTIVILGVCSSGMFYVFSKILNSVYRKKEITTDDFKEDKPEGQGVSDIVDRAGEIFKKIAECITYSIDSAANFDHAGYMSKFGKIAANYNSIERCLESVWKHVKPLVEWAFTSITGKPLFNTTVISNEVTSSLKVLDDMRRTYNECKRLSKDQAEETVKHADKLRATVADKLHVVLPSLASAVTAGLIASVDVVDYANELVHGAKFRPMPTWIHLVGPAGEGKTRLMNNLIKWTKTMVYPNDTNPCDRYDRKSCNEYWEGYTHQFCMVVDDLLQADDPESRRLAALEMIYAVNGNPYHLHFAGISDKKGQYFDSPFVYTTANFKQGQYLPDNLGLTDYEAFYRRMSIKVMVRRDKTQPNQADPYEDAKAKFKFTEILGPNSLGKTFTLDYLLSMIYTSHTKNISEFMDGKDLTDESLKKVVDAFCGRGDMSVTQPAIKATSPSFVPQTTLATVTTTTTTNAVAPSALAPTTTTGAVLRPVYRPKKPNGQADSDDDDSEDEFIIEEPDDDRPDQSSNSSKTEPDEILVINEPTYHAIPIEHRHIGEDSSQLKNQRVYSTEHEDKADSVHCKMNMHAKNYFAAEYTDADTPDETAKKIKTRAFNRNEYLLTLCRTHCPREYNDMPIPQRMVKFLENPGQYIISCDTTVATSYATEKDGKTIIFHKSAHEMLRTFQNTIMDENEDYVYEMTKRDTCWGTYFKADTYDFSRYFSSWTKFDVDDIDDCFVYGKDYHDVFERISKINNYRLKFAIYVDEKLKGNYPTLRNIHALNTLCLWFDVRIRVKRYRLSMETEIYYSAYSELTQDVMVPHWMDQVYNQYVDSSVKGIIQYRQTMTRISWKKDSFISSIKQGYLTSYSYKLSSSMDYPREMIHESNYLANLGCKHPEVMNSYDNMASKAFKILGIAGICAIATGLLVAAAELVSKFFLRDETVLGQSFDKNTEKKAKKNLMKKKPGMRKVPKNKGKPVKTQHFNVAPKGQSASSQMLAVKFAKNTEYITCISEDGQKARCFLTFVCGTTAVTAAHCFRTMKIQKIIIHWAVNEDDGEIELAKGDDFEISTPDQRDITMIYIKRDRIPQYKDIRKHLMTKKEYSELKDMTNVCKVTFADDGTLQTFCVNNARPSVGSVIEYKGVDCPSSNLWLCREMPNIPGDCGLPYFTLNDKFAKKFLGIHTAGTIQGSYFTPLYYEDFSNVPQGQTKTLRPDMIYASPQLEKITIEPLFGVLVPGCKSEGIIKIEKDGETKDLIAYQPTDTELRPTHLEKGFQFQDQKVEPIFTCSKKPAILKRFMKEKDGMKMLVDPLKNALDKFKGRNAPSPKFNPSDPKYWKGVYHSNFNMERVRMATRHEALNGIKGSEFCGPVDCSKSASIGFSEHGITSEKLFPRNIETGDRDYSVQMDQLLDAREEKCFKKNKVPPYVCHGTKKDELRMPGKVETPRLFCNGSKVSLIEARMAFMTFFEQVCNHAGEGDVYIGINPHGTHWRNLWKKMSMKSKVKIIADDIKTWDFNMKLWFIQGFEDEGRRQGISEEQLRRMVLNLRSILTPYVVIGGKIFRYIGMPSGSYLTAIVNSMYNSWMTRICWDMKHPDKNFDDFISQGTFGDDLIQAVLDALGKDEWNGKILAEMRKKYFNMETTSIFKDGREVPEFMNLEVSEWTDGAAQFIKRQFRVDNQFVYPILDIESINSMVSWVSPSKDRSMDICIKENIETALRELVYHGKEVYDRYFAYFQKYYHIKRWGQIPVSFSDELNKYTHS